MATDNGKNQEEEKKEEKQSDIKIAEIWIREGELKLEASKEFWLDKIRAIGILEYCKDVVKNANVKEDKPLIIPAKGSMMNFVRKMKRR